MTNRESTPAYAVLVAIDKTIVLRFGNEHGQAPAASGTGQLD
jgi:hypothetical protein